jgi:hypothetical protein
MNKIIITIILALLAGYTAFWYTQANHAKSFIAKKLDELEQPDSQGNRLQHAGLKIAGFPFSYEVKIKNPRYGNDKNQEAFIDGFLTLGTNLWGSKFWVQNSGVAHLLGGQSDHITISGDSTLSWNINNSNPLKSLNHPFNESEEQSPPSPQSDTRNEQIKRLHFNGRNLVVEESNGKAEKLGEIANVDLDFSMDNPSHDLQKYDINTTLEGLKLEEKALRNISELFNTHLKDQQSIDPNLIVAAGKMNIDLIGSITLPIAEFEGKFPPYLSVDIEKLNSQTIYGNKQLSGKLNYDERIPAHTRAQINLNSVYTCNEENYKNSLKAFIKMLQASANEPESLDATQTEKLKKLLACCQTELETIIPRYQDFGPIKMLVDGDANFNKENFSGEAQLRHLDLTSDLYGIRSNGTVQGQQMAIKGEYTIELLNYKAMIEDLTAYYNRIHFLFPIFAETPENAPPLISPPVTVDFLTFLRKISNKPNDDSNDLSVTINFLEPHAVKVGLLTLPEALVEWGKFQSKTKENLK